MTRASSLVIALVVALVGCGGSRDGAYNGLAKPKVEIAWPARGRSFSASGAATAARSTFVGAGELGGDVSMVVSRPEGAELAVSRYVLSQALKPGNYPLRVEFLATSDSSLVLAVANVSLQLMRNGELRRMDGQRLGTIGFESKVTALVLPSETRIDLGETVDFPITAVTDAGITALAPGSVRLALTSGEAFVRIDPSGSVTARSVGVATVVASVDGVSSSPAALRALGAPLTPRIFPLTDVTDLTVDPVRGKLWLIRAEQYGVQTFDPVTSRSGAVFTAGAEPTTLAISEDGTRVYAGSKAGGSIVVIDGVNEVRGIDAGLPRSPLGTVPYALQIAVQPGSNSAVALTSRDVAGNRFGPSVIDVPYPRPNRMGVQDGDRLVWTAPDRIVAYTLGGRMTELAVDSEGVTLIREVSATAGLTGLVKAGDRLYDRSGAIYDAATLVRLGEFPIPTEGDSQFDGPAIQTATGTAYYVEKLGTDVFLRSYNLADFTEKSVRRITGLQTGVAVDGLHTSLLVANPSTLAFRLNGGFVLLDNP